MGTGFNVAEEAENWFIFLYRLFRNYNVVQDIATCMCGGHDMIRIILYLNLEGQMKFYLIYFNQ